jgi:hypothetical protein
MHMQVSRNWAVLNGFGTGRGHRHFTFTRALCDPNWPVLESARFRLTKFGAARALRSGLRPIGGPWYSRLTMAIDVAF